MPLGRRLGGIGGGYRAAVLSGSADAAPGLRPDATWLQEPQVIREGHRGDTPDAKEQDVDFQPAQPVHSAFMGRDPAGARNRVIVQAYRQSESREATNHVEGEPITVAARRRRFTRASKI